MPTYMLRLDSKETGERGPVRSFLMCIGRFPAMIALLVGTISDWPYHRSFNPNWICREVVEVEVITPAVGDGPPVAKA